MIRQNSARLFVMACLVLLTPVLGAEQALSLRVTPPVADAPADVLITVTVERNTENRELVVEDDSENYYRSSAVQLEGDKAARTHFLVFRELPPGRHRISAAVRGTIGLRAAVSTSVTVIGFGSSEGIER